MPGDELAEREDRDKVPYRVWRDRGYLETRAEARRSIRRRSRRRFTRSAREYDVQEIGYDRWRIEDL
jgi:hypothetical protein